MDTKEFAKGLESRTRKFASRIIKFSSNLPDSPEGRVIPYQLSKAGTSIRANYREANRARSNADFSNKIKISESASSETSYWLEVTKDLGWTVEVEADSLLKESDELLANFLSISYKMQQKNKIK